MTNEQPDDPRIAAMLERLDAAESGLAKIQLLFNQDPMLSTTAAGRMAILDPRYTIVELPKTPQTGMQAYVTDGPRNVFVGGKGAPIFADEDGNWRYKSDDSLVVGSVSDARLDAFGRLRISEPHTIFDSKQLFDNAPLFWDDQEVSGSGTTSVHSTATASSVMGVSTAAGKRVRQTFMRFNYQSGKSQLIVMTGTLDLSGGGSGIKTAFGAFDDDNGIFWTMDKGTVKAVIRSSTSGSAVDDTVSQSSWDDPMDGDGASGITLDFTKSTIFVIDFQWLSSGDVRVGVEINSVIPYFHTFKHANILEGAYMSTPNLPLRYEIENDGTGVASTMRHICGSVMSEAGAQELGSLRWFSTGGTAVVTDNENEIFAVVGIRLKSTHLDAQIRLVNMSLQLQTATEKGEWILLLNPTVADTFTYSNQANSALQVATGATANSVTGGTQVAGGFAETAQKAGPGLSSELENAILLGSKIDGTPDEYVLCYRPTGGTSAADVEGGIQIREAA